VRSYGYQTYAKPPSTTGVGSSGATGFHEFVIIDRASAMLTLLVASDD
jgi:hypothetical protein